MPLSSEVSSAAHLATRTVDSALYDAIVAKAINKSTWAGGKLRAFTNGDWMLSNEKIVLNELIAERYVFFVP